MWQLETRLGRPPDLVVESDPLTIPAQGPDVWPDHRVGWDGIDETQWIMAAEIMPSLEAQPSLHHAHAILRQDGKPGSQRLSAVAAGKRWDIYPEGVGIRIDPGGGQVSWALHYHPVGNEITDVVKVGVWFYPEGERPWIETSGENWFRVDDFEEGQLRERNILIPPNGTATLQRTYVLDQPLLIHSYRPHMHMQGTGMTMEVVYPGMHEAHMGVRSNRREVLSSVDRYNHFWQIGYIYEDHAQPLLPKGSALVFTSHFDNTVNNPNVIDPDQWVAWGKRSIDAMSHALVTYTFLTDEQYERLKAERDARERQDLVGGGGG